MKNKNDKNQIEQTNVNIKELVQNEKLNSFEHNSYWINIPGFIILTLLWVYIMLSKYYS